LNFQFLISPWYFFEYILYLYCFNDRKVILKVKLIQIGKTDTSYINEGVELYTKRILKYHPYEVFTIPDIKNSKKMTEEQQKKAEGELILKQIQSSDFLVLLDENGKTYNSLEMAKFLEGQMLQSIKQMIFVIGGPYGFDSAVYERANRKIALSKMTFSHQLVRIIFAEQLYRANSIIKGEPYHHA
jgi:23S rRNA (pseudouridine1915-N3)-methyltransferase